MANRVARYFYERLGRGYKFTLIVTQALASMFVVGGIVAILTSFYDPPRSDIILIVASATLFALLAVSFALFRQRAVFEQLMAWREDPSRTPEETILAWDAATNMPMRSFRRDSLRVNALAAVPSVATMLVILDLHWTHGIVLLLAGAIAASYATVLNYSLTELLVRPLVEDISAELPDEFTFTRNGLPIRSRLMIGLPIFTALTGLIVSAFVTDRGGTDLLLVATVSSLAVGLALSTELMVLLSRAITTPLGELSKALARVREGDYGVRVPVVSSDELGELSDDFNRMAQGLAEREEIREAFSTYVDREVAEFILSGQFPKEGVEVDVSIMFCDLKDFTPYAERSDPTEVVAVLNELFSTIVPIVDRHGGHVDKFLGDGLLAVFGAPEGYTDHADRAVAAGLEIVEVVNREDGLEMRVGINSGAVVAGSIGGAGRLNFSVIGDTVNVAARVEAATRDTGDEMLVTRATREQLSERVRLVSRGTVPLKGKSEPVEVLAPVREPRRPAAEPGAAVPGTASSA